MSGRLIIPEQPPIHTIQEKFELHDFEIEKLRKQIAAQEHVIQELFKTIVNINNDIANMIHLEK